MAEDYKDISDILIRLNLAKDFSVGWHKNIDRWRRRYSFDHYEKKPKPGEDRYVDPTYTNTVDLAVGILQSNEFVWRAQGLRPSSNEQGKSSLIEKFIAGVIDINSDRSQADLKYETHINFVRDGGSCLYSRWDTDIHDSCFEIRNVDVDENGEFIEEKVFYELPLRVDVIDPLKIFVLPGGPRRWLMIARKEDMSIYDIEQTYDVEIKQYKTKTKTEKIDLKGEFIDYWDLAIETVVENIESGEEIENAEQLKEAKRKLVVRNAQLFENQMLSELRVMEGYNDLPYKINFYNPTSMQDSKMWHSILSPAEHTIMELENTINMRKKLLQTYSSLPMIIRTRDKRPIKIDPAVGRSVSLGLDEDAGFPRWEGTPPDFERHVELLRSRIQQSGFSDVMYGQGPSGISGYALSQLGDQNRLRLTTAITHLENLWTWSARQWLDLVKEFGIDASFEMYGHNRGVDFAEIIPGIDLLGYHVRCKIEPEFPNERVRNHAMATQAAAFLSARRIMEDYLGVQQPDDERIQKIIEQLETHPIAVQFAMMKELNNIIVEGGDDAEMAQQMLTVLQQQVYGMGGRPTEPNNPEQLMGVQSPTGEASQSAGNFPGSDIMQDVEQRLNTAAGMQGQIGGENV